MWNDLQLIECALVLAKLVRENLGYHMQESNTTNFDFVVDQPILDTENVVEIGVASDEVTDTNVISHIEVGNDDDIEYDDIIDEYASKLCI